MILPLMRASWTRLRRDRAAQVMLFIVPVAFFSIFAVIFGGRAGDGGTTRVTVYVVDESHTDASRALIKTLQSEKGLRVHTGERPAGAGDKAPEVPIDRARATALVRSGETSVALVLPAGIDTSLGRFDGRGVHTIMLADPSDPVAPRVIEGEMQYAAISMGDELAAQAGLGVAPPQGSLAERAKKVMPAPIDEQQVVGEKHEGGNGMVSFYAAGIAVMFLMFSASAAGGVLIEETESGTLERVLSTGAGMNTLLLSKWLYITGLGVLGIVVMFLWAAFAFHLPLATHLPGFAVMTVATALCSAAFGLTLATAARTRQQLQGMTNLIVLSLSALGGSMFPRFLMPEWMQKWSLVGFNAWALDGYLKVFWREAPVSALAPQVGALLGFTVLFLFLARRFAVRWEIA